MFLAFEVAEWYTDNSDGLQANLSTRIPIRDLRLPSESDPHVRPLALQCLDLLQLTLFGLLCRDRLDAQILERHTSILL